MARRLTDITLSLIGLVVALPALAVIAVLIAIRDGSPVI